MTADDLRKMIREWRHRFGWSQDGVATSIGMAQNQYSDYETGRRPINIDLLDKLARLYGRELVIDFRYIDKAAAE